ncbi:hypothetical protein J8273_0540 [Carpediemonas membranifera]|uniref:Uncharacterized protein n=1 Tax=Carpediemonas membranifera TaxID=201153 RepID=A0A8J6AZP7_9EUKA|nr:hypothetical protein J8273_0540 [Carpediemonas membranifera]|eukprot:KAG9395310.1 hypothetical protein J8273_0540 [Carpediemonas membranifera]
MLRFYVATPDFAQVCHPFSAAKAYRYCWSIDATYSINALTDHNTNVNIALILVSQEIAPALAQFMTALTDLIQHGSHADQGYRKVFEPAYIRHDGSKMMPLNAQQFVRPGQTPSCGCVACTSTPISRPFFGPESRTPLAPKTCESRRTIHGASSSRHLTRQRRTKKKFGWVQTLAPVHLTLPIIRRLRNRGDLRSLCFPQPGFHSSPSGCYCLMRDPISLAPQV